MKEIQKIDTTPTPVTLIERAIEKGADITQLKELMDLQERWEKKEAKKSFLLAKARFKAACPEIRKNKTARVTTNAGGSYSYNYPELGEIGKVIDSVLAEHGLSYKWEFAENNNKMIVTCIISHVDGHEEKTTMEAGLDNSGNKNDIQKKGSTHTYLQRYTLIAALGLTTADLDDDGKRMGKIKEVQPTDEDLEHWKQEVGRTKTKVELTNLYLKNKKVVEKNKDIQAIFKAHEAKLKTIDNVKVAMP